MADFGYDVSDHCAIDATFGDLPAFDRLLGDAHAGGLRVLLDWVPNHTSDRHPWFVESRSSRDSPKRDWYFWRDGRADGVAAQQLAGRLRRAGVDLGCRPPASGTCTSSCPSSRT